MYNCPICPDKVYQSINSITNHWTKSHKLDLKSLYLKLNNLSSEPTCACGCGSQLRFIDVSRGFTTYVLGHASRVKNNFQTEKSKTNSLKTRKKMLEDGTWKPFHRNDTGTVWNSGLSKESDERVNNIFIKRDTDEYKKKSSQRMSKGRKNGLIRTLYGKEHSQWNGGTSSLMAVCYSNKKLILEWKNKLLEQADYTCSTCKSKSTKENFFELQVHHDKIKMASIIRLIAEQEGWEDSLSSKCDSENNDKNPHLLELKNKISDLVVDFHVKNNVSGLVLCKPCHKLEHNKYNF